MSARTPLELMQAIVHDNPQADSDQHFALFKAALQSNSKLSSMVLDEVFGRFVAAHDHLDLNDFDMNSEIIPMVADWCEADIKRNKRKNPDRKRRER